MKQISAFVLFVAMAASASAQYCSPSFPNGCTLWRTQAVSVGSIDWVFDEVDCTASDHTDLSTLVNAGEATPMIMVSGNWCGCAVWVDLNNDLAFQDSENLYYSYVGGDPNYTYDFNITIPAGTPSGPHRMRVIAPWGSDGFLSTNTNGYGPCGDYQYGNFVDFTLNVAGDVGIAQLGTQAQAGINVGPDPAQGSVMLNTNDGALLEQVTLFGAEGRVVLQQAFSAASDRVQLELGALPSGVYSAQCYTTKGVRSVRLVKE